MRFSCTTAFLGFARNAALAALFFLLLSTSPSAVAMVSNDDGECVGVPAVALNSRLTADFGDGAPTRVFRLEIPAPGLLDLEATDLADDTGSTVALLGTDCRTSAAQGRASARHRLLEISRAGNYYVAVAAASPGPGSRFELRVGFAPGLDTAAVEVAGSQLHPDVLEPGSKGDDLDELIIDPGGNFIWVGTEIRFSLLNPLGEPGETQLRPGSKGDDLDELIIDPGGNFIYEAENWRFSLVNPFSESTEGAAVSAESSSELPTAPTPETSWSVRYAPVAVCPSAASGGHGASLACATELALDSRLEAAIDPGVAASHDVYGFSIRQRSTVVLETHGEIATDGELLDSDGARIVRQQGDASTGFHIATILEPGRYYLRIGAAPGSAGAYQLRIGTTPAED